MLFKKSTFKMLALIPKRNFFNFFNKKKEMAFEQKDLNQNNNDSLDIYKKNSYKKPRELTKVEKYYIELRDKREKEEKEKMKQNLEREEAKTSFIREHETTIKHYDYKSILLNNINILPREDFKNLNEFLYHFRKLIYERSELTEENFKKILDSFLHFADEIDYNQVQTDIFKDYLVLLRKYITTFRKVETIVSLVKFLDLYCIEYPEIWAKLQIKVLKMKDYIEIDNLIEILISFSNQGEGTEKFYDKLEKKILINLNILTIKKLTNIIQSYFNTKTGTQNFIDKLFERLIEKLNDNYLRPSFQDLKNVGLMVKYLQEDIFKSQREKLLKGIENQILEHPEELNFELSCIFAFIFGLEYGSKELFLELLKATESKLDIMTIEEYKLFVKGFFFTYRINEKYIDYVIKKFPGFKNELNPSELAQLAKSFYIFEKEDLPIFKEIESMIIWLFQNDPDILTKEDLYQIVFCFTVTRMGSRQFYKILEFSLTLKLKELGKDPELSDKLFQMFDKSGLCSINFLEKLSHLKKKLS